MSRAWRSAIVAVLLAGVGNGVRGQATQPIAGRVIDRHRRGVAAEVVLRWRVHPELPGLVGYTLGDRGVAESRHRSGDDGRFRLQLPHRGPFMLVAILDGSSSAQAFPVLAGDYVELQLEPSHRIAGTVVGGEGRPVAGADVRLLPDPTIWSRLGLYRIPERRGATTTDAEGRFALHFEHGYLRSSRMAPMVGPWVDTAASSNLPHALVRPNASSRNLRVELRPHTPARGRVVSRDSGAPIHRARVFDPVWPGRSTVTADDGSWELPNPVGASVLVEAAGWAPASVARSRAAGRFVTVDTLAELDRGRSLRVRLVDGAGRPLTGRRVLFAVPREREVPFERITEVGDDGLITLDWAPPRQALFGFVELDRTFVQFHGAALERDVELGTLAVAARELRGQLLGSDRTPLPHARVVLVQEGLEDLMPRVTYTDRGGRFRFDGVAAAPATVIAGTGWHGMARRRLSPEDLGGQIELAIEDGAAIAGTVVDLRGRPVPGAWVMISRGGGLPAGELPSPTTSSTTLCVLTDGEGRFRFRGLPADAGEWTVMGQHLRDDTVSAGSARVVAGTEDLVIHMTTHVR